MMRFLHFIPMDMKLLMRTVYTRILLILFGLGLVCLVEGGLRLYWSEEISDNSSQSWVKIDPFEVVGTELQVAPEYFGALRPVSFAREKPVGLLRIFCLGGSTTFGYPYPVDQAWPALLQQRLKILYPDQSFEVINLGGTSYGSSRILGLFRGILSYQPDLVVIAGGDAEFVEDSFRVSIDQQRLQKSWFQSLRLVALVRTVLPEQKLASQMIDADEEGVAGLLFSPVLDGTVYRPDSRKVQEVESRLKDNFIRISELAHAIKIPLILSTLPSNVADWPPDPDERLPEQPEIRLQWQKIWGEARAAYRQQQKEQAAKLYAAASHLWSGNATFCFEYGRILLEAGRADEAGRWLILARDLDPTPVRAGSTVNAIIRSIAQSGKHPLLDLDKIFSERSENGMIGDKLILDYAHPTTAGQLLIARTAWKGMNAIWPDWWDRFSTVKEAELRASEERLVMVEPTVDAQLAFVWGVIFERKGKLARAEKMFRLAIEQRYQGPYALLGLVTVLTAQGKEAEALPLARKLVATAPGFEEPYPVYAELLFRSAATNADRAEAASEWLLAYHQAVANSQKSEAFYDLAATVLFDNRQYSGAEQVLTAGLKLFPESCRFQSQYGRVLESTSTVTASSYYKQQLIQSPDCQPLYENLGILQMQLQEWTAARETFAIGLSRPEPPDNHHLNLGYVLWNGFQDRDGAAAEFRAYLKQNPSGEGFLPLEFQTMTTSRDQVE